MIRDRVYRWMAVLKSPVGIAWVVAAFVTLTLVTAIGRFDEPPARDRNADAPGNNSPAAPAAERKAAQPQLARADEVEAWLNGVGTQLEEYRARHGHFPSGARQDSSLPPEQRFSWMAELAALDERNGIPPPLWDRAWRDPLNDRFVRRRMPEYQNPLFSGPVGADRYPATNVVGMAGVGADAPTLPIDHPRAGVFGIERRTAMDDITDGTANTILLAGVREQLGSWAAGGQATVRGFVTEPYVNGPDGFGTGDANSMLVVMADGSLRTISKRTDPRIVRRMAAMADGLGLELKIPGEPGETPVRSPAKPGAGDDEVASAQMPKPTDHPLNAVPKPGKAHEPESGGPVAAAKPDRPLVPAAPPEPAVDVSSLLSQKILRYERKQPASYRTVILEVEEMAGLPIRFDEAELGASAAAALEKSVTVETLENTTVGALLETILKSAGLAYRIERDGIRLRVRVPDAEGGQS